MSGSEAGMIQRNNDNPAAYLGAILLMMSVAKGQYFSLNEVGTRIWELMQHPTTQADLVQHLVTEYEVPSDVCAAEVAVFVDALRQRDLLNDVA